MTRKSLFGAFASVVFFHAFSGATALAASPQLIEAAKREGQLNWYTTLIVNQMARPAVEGFQKKYGIKVNYIRADTGDLLTRIETETKAGGNRADLIDTTSGTIALRRLGLLDSFVPDSARDLPKEYIHPEGHWVAASLYIQTLGYNTDLVRREDAPKSLKDLLDPKWRGKLGLSASSSSPGVGGFVALALATFGEEEGVNYLKALAAQRVAITPVSARRILDQVIAGEYDVGLQILNHHVAFSRSRGAPVGWMPLDPAMATMLVLCVLKGPQPSAARLMVDYLISEEGQKLFRDADYIPVAPNVPPRDPGLRPDGKNFRARFFTPEQFGENTERWMKIYADILKR